MFFEGIRSSNERSGVVVGVGGANVVDGLDAETKKYENKSITHKSFVSISFHDDYFHSTFKFNEIIILSLQTIRFFRFLLTIQTKFYLFIVLS